MENDADFGEFAPAKEGVQSEIRNEDLMTAEESVAVGDQTDILEGDEELPAKEPPKSVENNHPLIDLSEEVNTRNKPIVNCREMVGYVCYTSTLEPKNVKEALEDECWIVAMQEELEQFERSQVWDLVPRPKNTNVIGTKWIYKNITDEAGNITRNKARLVAQGYTH